MLDKNYIVLTEKYIKALNERDVEVLKTLYSDSVSLNDWYGLFVGKDSVLSENSKLFEKNFSINLTQILQTDNISFAFLTLNIDDNVIHIVDKLEWDGDFKIKTIEAYWR